MEHAVKAYQIYLRLNYCYCSTSQLYKHFQQVATYTLLDFNTDTYVVQFKTEKLAKLTKHIPI